MTTDALDRSLLTLLQANARESTANLARKLGIARTTVVARLARLERDGVSIHPLPTAETTMAGGALNCADGQAPESVTPPRQSATGRVSADGD